MRWEEVSRGRLIAWSAALTLGPLTLLIMEIAFRYPAHTERIYGEWIYPRVASVLGALNRPFPFSLAQLAGDRRERQHRGSHREERDTPLPPSIGFDGRRH